MKKFLDAVWEKLFTILPVVWATLFLTGVTVSAVTFCIWSIKTFLHTLGVV